jgi:hypothetical protein
VDIDTVITGSIIDNKLAVAQEPPALGAKVIIALQATIFIAKSSIII